MSLQNMQRVAYEHGGIERELLVKRIEWRSSRALGKLSVVDVTWLTKAGEETLLVRFLGVSKWVG